MAARAMSSRSAYSAIGAHVPGLENRLDRLAVVPCWQQGRYPPRSTIRGRLAKYPRARSLVRRPSHRPGVRGHGATILESARRCGSERCGGGSVPTAPRPRNPPKPADEHGHADPDTPRQECQRVTYNFVHGEVTSLSSDMNTNSAAPAKMADRAGHLLFADQSGTPRDEEPSPNGHSGHRRREPTDQRTASSTSDT